MYSTRFILLDMSRTFWICSWFVAIRWVNSETGMNFIKNIYQKSLFKIFQNKDYIEDRNFRRDGPKIGGRENKREGVGGGEGSITEVVVVATNPL